MDTNQVITLQMKVEDSDTGCISLEPSVADQSHLGDKSTDHVDSEHPACGDPMEETEHVGVPVEGSEGVHLDSNNGTKGEGIEESKEFDGNTREESLPEGPSKTESRMKIIERPFQCQLCKNLFRAISGLKSHIRSHAKEHKFLCKHCGMPFTSKKDLEDHGPAHLQNRIHTCGVCGKQYHIRRSYRRHIASHSAEPHRCAKCGRQFKAKLSLDRHSCGSSTKKVQSSSEVVTPSKRKLPERKLKITVRTLRNYRTVEAEQEDLTDDGNAVKDEASKMIVPFKKRLLARKSKTAAKGHRDHDAIEAKQGDLTDTTDAEEEEGKKSSDSDSDWEEEYASSLRKKAASRRSAKTETVLCQLCKKVLPNLSFLISHFQSHKEESLGLLCKHCGESFDSDGDLRDHLRGHNREETFTCNVCSERCQDGTSYNRHLLSHSEEERRKCDNSCREFEIQSSREGHSCQHSAATVQVVEAPPKSEVTDQNADAEPVLFKDHTVAAETVDLPDSGEFATSGAVEKKMLDDSSSQRDMSYVCRFCGKSFSSIQYRKVHEFLHSGEKPYGCSVCGRHFNSKRSWRRHRKVHSRDHFRCSNCNRDFRAKSWYDNHKCVGDKGRSLCSARCKYCSKAFVCEASRDKHERAHESQTEWHCDVCNETFEDIERWKQHTNGHQPYEPFKCKHCDKKFDTREQRRSHLRSHGPGRQKNHSCKSCGVRFMSKKACENHENIHTGERPYKCSFCGKLFHSQRSWRCHERIHKEGRRFLCHFCGKGLISKSDLVIHERIHTGEKPFLCQACGMTFRRKAACQDHYKARHCQVYQSKKTVKSLACSVCGKSFSHRGELRAHTRVHTGEKPFSCEYCKEAFMYQRSLKKHLYTHTGVYPYPCRHLVCDVGFLDCRSRRSHEVHNHSVCEVAANPCLICSLPYFPYSHVKRKKTHPAGEKPFKCSYCEKMFSNTSDHRKHEMTHTGEKPYPCKYCDKWFARQWGRNKHQFNRHERRKEKYSCKVCGKEYKVKCYRDAHEKSHDKIKEKSPCICSFCGKSYTTMHSLQRHERNHTGEKPYPCQYCQKHFIRKDYRDEHEVKSCHLRIK